MRCAIIGVMAVTLTVSALSAQNDGAETGSTIVKKPWFAPLASLLVPGSGQLLSGHERGALYIAAEVLFAAQYFSSRSEGSRERDRFRDLAFDVARAPFAPTMRDTVFEYFEQMEQFIESGPSTPTPAQTSCHRPTRCPSTATRGSWPAKPFSRTPITHHHPTHPSISGRCSFI